MLHVTAPAEMSAVDQHDSEGPQQRCFVFPEKSLYRIISNVGENAIYSALNAMATRLEACMAGREREMKDISRREFVRGIGIGAIGLGFGVSLFDGIYQCAEAFTEDERHFLLMRGSVNFKGFMAKEITPSGQFYITTYSDAVPAIAPQTFNLRIEGLVEKPGKLSLKDLEQMADKEEFVTLECIGNPVGGDAIGNALWRGVSLRSIIKNAVPQEGIVKVALFAEDGYSDSIPYALALSGDVLLAYSMNGEPLPKEHGYPLRAIVPGIYGMKHVKWLSKIELVNYDFKGYWQKRGWSDEAVIPIKSEILMPMQGKTIPRGNYIIGGVAFAGRHGINKVQVSVDDKKTWADAELKPPLSRWAWVLWRYDWKPSGQGDYLITVRGVDRAGKTQESPSLVGRLFGTYPSGAQGLHTVKVSVG